MSKKFKSIVAGPNDQGHVFVCIGETVRYGFSSMERFLECQNAHDICNQRANLMLENLKDDDEFVVTNADGSTRVVDGRFVKEDLLKNVLDAKCDLYSDIPVGCTCSMADPLKCEACQKGV